LDFTAFLVKLAHLGWGYLNAPCPHSKDAFKCPMSPKGQFNFNLFKLRVGINHKEYPEYYIVHVLIIF
jgi:hypothetical protein